MSENKRFVDYFDKDHNYIIQDLVNEDEYQVGFCNCDEDKFLELVNALAETSCDCITDCEIVMKKLKEENEQLKHDATVLIQANQDYRRENEQLKQQLADVKKENYGNLDGLTYKDEVEIPKLSERISDIECENEQLKEENKQLKQALEKDIMRACEIKEAFNERYGDV